MENLLLPPERDNEYVHYRVCYTGFTTRFAKLGSLLGSLYRVHYRVCYTGFSISWKVETNGYFPLNVKYLGGYGTLTYVSYYFFPVCVLVLCV